MNLFQLCPHNGDRIREGFEKRHVFFLCEAEKTVYELCWHYWKREGRKSCPFGENCFFLHELPCARLHTAREPVRSQSQQLVEFLTKSQPISSQEIGKIGTKGALPTHTPRYYCLLLDITSRYPDEQFYACHTCLFER